MSLLLFNKWNFKRIVVHVLFWLSYLLFFGLIYGKYGNNYSWYFLEMTCMLPFVMLATYVTIYAILPYYLKERKLLTTVIVVSVLLFLTALGARIFLRKLNSLPVTLNSLFGITFLYLVLETNFIVGIAVAVKMTKMVFEQKQEKYEFEKESLKTELAVLNAQLHPHFLFNTMNNLYALSLEKSSKTSEGIAKISELLRSILYECDEKEIPLQTEINLIENYIDLEKMRFGKQLHVNFEIKGPVGKKKIAPMVLFTFIENCFKHGGKVKNPYINISIKVSENTIRFYAVNNKSSVQNNTSEKNSGGIGLVNVKKRLEIIYGENYFLEISEKDKKHHVLLEIIGRNE